MVFLIVKFKKTFECEKIILKIREIFLSLSLSLFRIINSFISNHFLAQFFSWENHHISDIKNMISSILNSNQKDVFNGKYIFSSPILEDILKMDPHSYSLYDEFRKKRWEIEEKEV